MKTRRWFSYQRLEGKTASEREKKNFWRAVKKRNLYAVLQYVKKYGNDPKSMNIPGEDGSPNPLYYVCRKAHYASELALYKCIGSVHDNFQMDLKCASRRIKVFNMALLILSAKSIDVNAVHKTTGESILHERIKDYGGTWNNWNDPALDKRLLRHEKLDKNIIDLEGNSPLLAVISHAYYHLESALLLLADPDVDVNVRNIEEETALHLLSRALISTEEDDAKKIFVNRVGTRLLERNDLDCDARNRFGNTALIEAARYNNSPLVEAILRVGKHEINAANTCGNTALLEAARFNNPWMIRALLQSGADVFHVNSENNTALDIAKSYGHLNIATIIEYFAKKLQQHPTLHTNSFFMCKIADTEAQSTTETYNAASRLEL